MPGCHTASRHQSQQKLLVGLLARLVGNAAAGLASALAGSLAFAATAMHQGLLQARILDSFDMLHGSISSNSYEITGNRYIIHDFLRLCNHFGEIFDRIAPMMPPPAMPMPRSAR